SDISYQPLTEDEEIEGQLTSPRNLPQSSKSPPKRISRDVESHGHFDDQILRDVEVTAEVTSFVYFIAVVIAIGGFLFGYDTGVISSAMLLLEQEFTMTALQKGIIVGGAVFGGAIAGYLSDLMGRKITTILSALTFLVGAIILSIAYTYSSLVFGRLIIGLGVGLASMVVPIYISEISPRYYRGRLVTLNVLFITGGQVFAYLVGIAFVEKGGWRWMFGVSGIPPLIQLFVMPIIPESPRFLVRKGKSEEAKRVLRKIYPNSPKAFVDEEIHIIYETIAVDASGSYRKLIQYPNLRPLIIACGLQAIQQLTGFDTAMYYGATIMKMAGFINIRDAIMFSLVVSLTNFLMTAVALNLIDRVGRRKILLNTVIATIVSLLLLGIGFYFITGFTVKQPQCMDYGDGCGACLLDDRCGFAKRDGGICLPRQPSSDLINIEDVNILFEREEISGGNSLSEQANGNFTDIEFYDECPNMKLIYTWFALICLVLYVMAYALGLGHAPWLIQSEIFPLNVRGRATGIATATNWLVNLAITVSFLPLTEMITTSGTFWLYASFMIFGWIFIYLMVPETAGKSLEEIQELFY
ncbi:10313_t:CDS:10, partial [Funneliformis mosseae]